MATLELGALVFHLYFTTGTVFSRSCQPNQFTNNHDAPGVDVVQMKLNGALPTPCIQSGDSYHIVDNV